MSDGGGSLGDAWIQIRAANNPSVFVTITGKAPTWEFFWLKVLLAKCLTSAGNVKGFLRLIVCSSNTDAQVHGPSSGPHPTIVMTDRKLHKILQLDFLRIYLRRTRMIAKKLG